MKVFNVSENLYHDNEINFYYPLIYTYKFVRGNLLKFTCCIIDKLLFIHWIRSLKKVLQFSKIHYGMLTITSKINSEHLFKDVIKLVQRSSNFKLIIYKL